MNTSWLRRCLCWGVLLGLGCRPSAVPRPGVTRTDSVTVSEAVEQSLPADGEQAVNPAAPQPDGSTSPASVEGEVNAAQAAESPSTRGETDENSPLEKEQQAEPPSQTEGPADSPAAPRVAAERIMLLLSDRPLLVDLRISVAGKPYDEQFAETLDGILTLADSDADGQVTWDEILAHPRFRDGQFGNPATSSYQARQDLMRLYDSTMNGRVDRDELVRYLTSNQATAQALTLTTSNSRRSYNRDRSPLREWLDVNADLVLSADEIAGAASRLRMRDIDEDEVLLPGDFVDGGPLQPGMMAASTPTLIGPPQAGWLIREKSPWNEILAGWETLYALGRPITANVLATDDSLFSQLNIDQDTVLSAFEMAMLGTVEPHIELDVSFGGAGPEPVSIRLAALRLPLEQTEGVVQHQSNRITIRLPGTTLDLFAYDSEPMDAYAAQAKNLLRQADGDRSGDVSEEEFAAIRPFVNVDFAGTDLDGDGCVRAAELTELLQQRSAVRRARFRVQADDQADALWPSLDLNSDGRIDSREIAEAPETLAMLDADEDGQVRLQELAGAMVIGVVRGGPGFGAMDAQSMAIPTVVRQVHEGTPRWFSGMDRNRDLGISWREFVGTREQFELLDEDRDGFIVFDEVSHLFLDEKTLK